MQLSLFQSDPPAKKTVCEDPRILMRRILETHLPEISIGVIIDWLFDQKVQLRISNSRTSKFGDYRPPRPGSVPRISVNHNLNKFAFLITLVHEMAHHMVLGGIHERHFVISFRKKNRPKPHGTEWQSHYRILMDEFMNPAILPRGNHCGNETISRKSKSFYDCRSKTFQGIKKVRQTRRKRIY